MPPSINNSGINDPGINDPGFHDAGFDDPDLNDPEEYPPEAAWTIDIDTADDRTLAAAFAEDGTDDGDLADLDNDEWDGTAGASGVGGASGVEGAGWFAEPQRPPSLMAPLTRPLSSLVPPLSGLVPPLSGARRAARAALGLALLAADQAQARQRLAQAGRRVLGPPAKLVDEASTWAMLVPGAGLPVRSLSYARAQLRQAAEKARQRGRATAAAGRDDARELVRTGVDQTLHWVNERALPRLVDPLVPYLIDSVVPRVLVGALPQIRTVVVPAIIDELAASPQFRELIVDQGRDIVDDAAEHLRGRTARADDRVEEAFRRLVGAGSHAPGTQVVGAPVDDLPSDALPDGELSQDEDGVTSLHRGPDTDRPPWADDR